MSINVLEKIDRLRTQRNWSMYELAEKADIPQSTLSNMFLRKTLPSINTLSKLCDAFSISMAEFFIDSKQDALNFQSLEFVEAFKNLSTESQHALINFLKTLEN